MEINYIYPLIITEILLLFFTLYFTQVDYTSPSVVTLVMFLLSTICVLWNKNNWNVIFNGKTFLIVIVTLFVMSCTELLMYTVLNKKSRWLDQEIIKNETPFKVANTVMIGVSVLSFIFMMIFIREVRKLGGGGLASIAIVKQDEELEVSSIAKIALRVIRVLPYPCIFIFAHNVILCKQRISKNLKLFIPVIMAVIVIFFSGSRGPYVYIVLSAFVYVVMFERYKNGWKNINIKKYIKPIIISIVLFMFIFVGTRSLVKGHEFTSTAIEYVTFYFGSPIHLLNKIVNDISLGFPTEYKLFGANTFASFYEEMHKFGLVNESIQLNQTAFIAVGGNFIGGGNVFTFIASPLNDFGVIGLLIYVFFFYAIICGFYYRRIKNCRFIKRNYISVLLYGYFFYLIFMTFYVTTTVYLKMQTILEVVIMLLFYEIMIKFKVKFGKL